LLIARVFFVHDNSMYWNLELLLGVSALWDGEISQSRVMGDDMKRDNLCGRYVWTNK